MSIALVVAYISYSSVGVPLTIACVHRRGSWQTLRPLILILISSLLTDTISMVLMRASVNTYLLLNGYLILQTALLIWLFRREFQNHLTIDYIQIAFLIFAVTNLLLVQGIWIFNSVTNVVACLVMTVFALFYLYRLLHELPIVHVHHLPMLWITFGVMTYYAGNLFLFLAKNYLTFGDSGSHRHMWILHNLLNIAKNMLFAIALWQSYRRVKSPISSLSAP
jgi:hypothetical protein